MRLLLAAAALLAALAPGAALAHGDERHAAAESAPRVFAHPSCPGGGECCCRGVVGTGPQPPTVLSPGWTFADAARSSRQPLPARDAVYARPLHSPLLSRAPPVAP